jgi:WS/DGAT/MGAT family acyltransferase
MVGLIAKVHHSVVDGVAGAEMLAKLLDLTQEGSAVTEPCPPWMPARLPSRAELITDALPTFVRSPIRGLRAAREVGRTAVRLARCAVDDRLGPVSIPLGAPDTFESPVGADRAVSFAELSMEDARALKARFGSTINDVVLGVCSGALRSHLAAHGQDVESPLVAVVPVSVREDTDGAAVGNQLSAMFVPLANDKKTPLERLRSVTAASASCKSQERAVGYGPMASMLTDAMPPALVRPMVQFGVRAGVVRKLRAGNLMISNVPGPDFALYFAGMRMEAVYPMGPVVDGVALNITVQSYEDTLYVGINSGASALPDLPGLARAMVDELALLGLMARGTAGQARHHRPSPSGAVATPSGHRPASVADTPDHLSAATG